MILLQAPDDIIVETRQLARNDTEKKGGIGRAVEQQGLASSPSLPSSLNMQKGIIRKRIGIMKAFDRTFDEARKFVRSLGLKPQTQWKMGSGKSKKILASLSWRPFEQARAFVRSLGLKSQAEWRAWSKTDARPDDIPTCPNAAYKGQWKSWGDLLGEAETS